ncbi:MAG: hypothetical protein KAU52_08240, partial [Methanosarcinales archaeon]|nr:hypothetical protein [Methanosarcinales archaeon]
MGKAGKNEVRGNPGGAGGNAFGIHHSDSANNTLLRNSISGITGGRGGNGGEGWGWGSRSGSGGTGGISAAIYIANSANNSILCNTISSITGGDGGNGGIGLTGGAGGAGGTGAGVYLLAGSDDNDLQDNTISYIAGGDGGGGGTLGSTGGNGGMAVGDYLLNSDNNTATGNSIFNTSGGAGGLIYGSRGADGAALGVYLSLSGGNLLYRNDISNNTNYDAYDDNINQWDSGTEGNYYGDDYTGTDPDGDGIGNTPYSIPPYGTSIDRFPLMQPWEVEEPIIAPIHDLNSSVGSTWINWTWKNPDDGVFNHTMGYIDNVFTTNTSGTNYNSTNLLPGTTHTISTRTVSAEGILSQTWVNDTATTIGGLSGGLFVDVLEPTMYSAYPVGETVKFNVTVMDSTGTPINSGVSVNVDLVGPNDASRHLILSNEENNFVGIYNISNEDARGLWTVNITAYNTTNSGQASIKVLFIGAYFIQPYTDSRSYMLGETANFTARVTKSGNIPLTDQNVSLNLSAHPFNDSTLVLEPVEMTFNDASGLFECSVDTSLLGSGIFSVVFSGNDTDGNTETGSLTIGVSEDFNITVGTDKAYYDRNEPVDVCGLVEFTDGTPLSNTNVSLRIHLKGFMRSYTATTNETGGFNFMFQPFAAEAGNYTVMATATNIALRRTAENHFTIHGLYLAPPSRTLDMAESSSREIDFILYNLGETKLTGIAATVDDLNISDNVDAAIVTTVPGELQPSESAYITLNVSAGTPVPAEAAFLINVSTDQMSDETSELHVNLFSYSPVVIIEPDTIAVSMNR